MAGFWKSVWTALKPVAQEAIKDAASALLKKKFGAKTTDATGKSGKIPGSDQTPSDGE